ncbi:hypothetical protein AGMMS50268_38210 [Spirochaetia bacterium]|nr:hypothetical protein AGMMS50268_38210 [Spirochaetia bacterium]
MIGVMELTRKSGVLIAALEEDNDFAALAEAESPFDYALHQVSQYGDFSGAFDGLEFYYGLTEEKARTIVSRAIDAFDKAEMPCG